MNSEPNAIIVIGGGLAGYCAALEAAAHGAPVMLIEKQPECGGSTVLSGGFFAFAGTDVQQKTGVNDTSDLLYEDLRQVGGDVNDTALLRAYADGQLELYHWLIRRGAVFGGLELSAGQSVSRSHQTNMPALMAALKAEVDGHSNVSVHTNTPVTRILLKDGRVAGVLLKSGTSLPAKAVIIASGGFSRSEDLLRLFAPAQSAALRIGGAGSTGDGLRMAWAIGAGMRDMGQIKGTFGTHPDTGPEHHTIMLAFYLGAIIVNQAGRRFIDESVSYKLLGDACLQQSGRIAFQVLDQTVMDTTTSGTPLFDFAPAIAAGTLLMADTLADLATACEIDPVAFETTVADYNAGIATGREPEFGRDGLCNHSGSMIPIAKPPFYAYPSTSTVLATYCGLATTPRAEVLDVFDTPIPGLFAAGEVVGGFHGASYMTGSSLGKAAFFGRVAGRMAVGA